MDNHGYGEDHDEGLNDVDAAEKAALLVEDVHRGGKSWSIPNQFRSPIKLPTDLKIS